VSAEELLRNHRAEILRIALSHGARHVRVFGSAARGESTERSDIDLLVDVESGRSLLDLVALSQDLEDLLGRRVDVLTDRSISPYLRDRIHSEAKPL
jgi:predicted nucleotidyltransferase